MADTGDVETALVALLDAALYPSGDSNPSVIGSSVNIARGWPTEADLRAAVSNGSSLLRVYGIPNLSKDDTRYQRVWRAAPSAASTLTASAIRLHCYIFGYAGHRPVRRYIVERERLQLPGSVDRHSFVDCRRVRGSYSRSFVVRCRSNVADRRCPT